MKSEQKEYITEITQGKTKSYHCGTCNSSFSSERYALNTHKCFGPEETPKAEAGATDPAIPDPGPVSPEVPSEKASNSFTEVQENLSLDPRIEEQEREILPENPNSTSKNSPASPESDSTSRDSTSTDCNAIDGEDPTVRFELLEEMEEMEEEIETQVCPNSEGEDSPGTILFELFECPLCRQSLEDQNSLNNHYLTEHCPPQGPYTCFLCNEVFELKDRLGDHLLEKHSETLVLSEGAQDVAYNVEC
jgi:hypothetical protein